jgi:hypothetical protein
MSMLHRLMQAAEDAEVSEVEETGKEKEDREFLLQHSCRGSRLVVVPHSLQS